MAPKDLNAVYGRHPVVEALRAGVKLERLYIAQGLPASNVIDEIIALAQSHAVPIERVARRMLAVVSGTEAHQGVAAVAPPYGYADVDLLIKAKTARLILLDGVTDPSNLGSILRSAEAFGWTGVLVPRNRAVGVTPSVRKVAAGAADRVPVAQVGSPAEAILRLQKNGFWVLGLDPSGTVDYREAGIGESKVCLVLGAEGSGLSRLVKQRCDALALIPMVGELASINVAVAAAVVMVEVTRSDS
ncbi:MAG: 23S rRNA (guanosine(2251)-2'-O)-methyltransferase RlmB [Actinomycetota bacterium]